MKHDLSGYVIMSDVDGTLITQDGNIPKRNVEAISRFVEKGGKFAIASGRPPRWVKYLAEALPVNAPCALINGCVLYDFQQQKTLWQHPLPDYAKEYADQLQDMPPEVGVIVMTMNGYYNIRSENELVRMLLERRKSKNTKPVNWRSIQEDWFHVVLMVPEACFEESMSCLAKKELPGVRFIPSGFSFIEMMPAHVNKGTALEKLARLGGYDISRIAAIGDFYNDVEMIKAAGIGAAVAGAPDEVKACAGFIAGPCENGAIADLVEYLESI